MFRVLRTALIFFFVLACYAVGVLWFWESTHRAVSGQDILIYLLLIPAVLLIAALVLFIRARSKATGQDDAPPPPPDPTPGETQAARTRDIAVFGYAVSTPLGDDWGTIKTALHESPVADLDETLLSEDGIPLRARRNRLLDDELQTAARSADPSSALEGDEEDAAQQAGDVWSLDFQQMDESLQRSGLLLSKTIGQLPALPALAAALAERQTPAHAARTVDLHPAWSGEAPATASTPAPSAQHILPRRLYVYLFVDAKWSPTEQAFLQSCVRAGLRAQGFADDSVALETLSCRSGDQLYQYVDDVRAQAESTTEAALWLLLAGTSTVSQSVIEKWEAQGDLRFVKGGQTGYTPGETGAALLLGNERIRHPELKPMAHLSPILQNEKPLPPDHSPSSAAETLAQLWARLQIETRVSGVDIACAVADCEALGPQSMEIGRFATDKLPGLLDEDRLIQLGSSWGECAPASALASLAVAIDAAQTDNSNILLAGLGPRLKRSMCIVRPQPDDAEST